MNCFCVLHKNMPMVAHLSVILLCLLLICIHYTYILLYISVEQLLALKTNNQFRIIRIIILPDKRHRQQKERNIDRWVVLVVLQFNQWRG